MSHKQNLHLTQYLDTLPGARVVCVGDVMLDQFFNGTVDRISPEAPIPVLRVENQNTMLGGSGNVLRNLAVLGMEVDFFSIVGDDQAGHDITKLVEKTASLHSQIFIESGRKTTIKSRFMAGSQQMLRADQESTDIPRDKTMDRLIETACKAIQNANAVVLSDYNKGVLTQHAAQAFIKEANAKNIPVIIDPKGTNYQKYKNATLICPNLKELYEATHMPVENDIEITDAAKKLLKDLSLHAVLVTRSKQGMSLITQTEAHHFPTIAREVFDVSGAGDTVLSTMAACLARNVPLIDAAQLANAAAGIVVGKIGTAVAYPEEIINALVTTATNHTTKIVSNQTAMDQIATWKRQGKKIGFTNGCFDLLHPGHISLLSQARAACDRLIVALNTDASVKRLKGQTRPVQSESARATVLASLASVDMVILFDEDTPLNLIRDIKPDLLVKGADYKEQDVVGGDIVKKHGGKILLATLAEGFSTTATIKKIEIVS